MDLAPGVCFLVFVDILWVNVSHQNFTEADIYSSKLLWLLWPGNFETHHRGICLSAAVSGAEIDVLRHVFVFTFPIYRFDTNWHYITSNKNNYSEVTLIKAWSTPCPSQAFLSWHTFMAKCSIKIRGWKNICGYVFDVFHEIIFHLSSISAQRHVCMHDVSTLDRFFYSFSPLEFL